MPVHARHIFAQRQKEMQKADEKLWLLLSATSMRWRGAETYLPAQVVRHCHIYLASSTLLEIAVRSPPRQPAAPPLKHAPS